MRRDDILIVGGCGEAGGSIVAVDHRRPPGWWGGVVFRLEKLYEAEPLARFIASDLRERLRRAGIDVKDARYPLLGGIQIVRGVSHGADRPRRAMDGSL